MVRAFKRIPYVVGDSESAPNKWRAMLRGNSTPFDSDLGITFTDIAKVVDGFLVIGYREEGPTACP